jgi:hypothetical protein
MNHQPFETWILDPLDLEEPDQTALRHHLEACQDCRQLQKKWLLLHQELRTPPILAPRPGFTRRWQAGMAERRLREQRRQAWKLFLLCSGAATAVLLIMVGYILLTSSPAAWIQAAMRTINGTLGAYSSMRDLATTWMSMTPLGLNVVIWAALIFSFCLLAITWAFAMWRTAFAGVWNK